MELELFTLAQHGKLDNLPGAGVMDEIAEQIGETAHWPAVK